MWFYQLRKLFAEALIVADEIYYLRESHNCPRTFDTNFTTLFPIPKSVILSDIYSIPDWSGTKEALRSSSVIRSCRPLSPLPSRTPPSFATAVVVRENGSGAEMAMNPKCAPDQIPTALRLTIKRSFVSSVLTPTRLYIVGLSNLQSREQHDLVETLQNW